MILFHQIIAAVIKETRLILRDPEALATLFIMPAIFVLVMSLALQDAFSSKGTVRFDTVIIDLDNSDTGKAISDAFDKETSFDVTRYTDRKSAPARDQLQEDIREGRIAFAIVIGQNTTRDATRRARQQLDLAKGKQRKSSVAFLADPALRAEHRAIVVNVLNRVLQGMETKILLQQFSRFARDIAKQVGRDAPRTPQTVQLFETVVDPYEQTGDDKDAGPMPTSVQQNAPGWGLLAMFFIVIPLSGTLVREQREGSLMRLQTMAAPVWLALGGKIIPYFVVNLIQMTLILLEGMYLLPLLGGQALEPGQHPEAIAFLVVCLSVAAIGYGLLVAAFARTPEQATIFGATSVLLLGAIGGIMVPKIVMPPTMQALTVISPMSWGLDGFLAIFVRGADTAAVLEPGAMLAGLGLACFAVGALRFAYRLQHK